MLNRREAIKGMGALAMAPFVPLQRNQLQHKSTSYSEKLLKEKAIAVLLANQRRHNPKLIPEMEKLFTDTQLWDLVSIQPAVDDESLAYYINFRPDKHDSLSFNLTVESENVKVDKVTSSDLASMERVIVDALRNISVIYDYDNRYSFTSLKEYTEGMYIKNMEISHVIHRRNLRAGANRIITSPEFASIYETATAGWEFSEDGWNFAENCSKRGVVKSGTICNRWHLYKDELYPKDESLMFYKGDSYLDASCIFTPLYLENRYTLRYGITFPMNGDYATLRLT